MGKILTILFPIVKIVVGSLTPEVKEAFEKFVKEQYERAKGTSNPFDDLAVEVLASIFGVELT
jgi:hypothetical protein